VGLCFTGVWNCLGGYRGVLSLVKRRYKSAQAELDALGSAEATERNGKK
jgi:hypothetical protein